MNTAVIVGQAESDQELQDTWIHVLILANREIGKKKLNPQEKKNYF